MLGVRHAHTLTLSLLGVAWLTTAVDPPSGIATDAVLSSSTIITPDVSAFVEGVLNSSTIPGVTMGVVRLAPADKQPVVELAAWGRQTEEGDGHDLTPDASVLRYIFL